MSRVQPSFGGGTGDGGAKAGAYRKWLVAAWLLTPCYATLVLPLMPVSFWMVTEIQSPLVNQVWGVSGLILSFLLVLSAASVVLFLLLRTVAAGKAASVTLVLSRYGFLFLMLWGVLVALQAYMDKDLVDEDWRLVAGVLSLLYFSLAPGLELALCMLLSKSVRRLRELTNG